METLLSIFNSINKEQALALVDSLQTNKLEDLYNNYPEIEQKASWRDVFYEHTWSLDFLERHLSHEDTDFWKHVSVWYELDLGFCQRNILHLDLESLKEYQLDISSEWLDEQIKLYYGEGKSLSDLIDERRNSYHASDSDSDYNI